MSVVGTLPGTDGKAVLLKETIDTDKKPMKICVIVAMDREFEMMKESLSTIVYDRPGHCVGLSGMDTITVVKGGIGKVNSALTTLEMILCDKPDCIISTGVAGGIDRDLLQGDIVVGECTTYHDFDTGSDFESQPDLGFPEFIPAAIWLLSRVRGAAAGDPKVRYGVICTGDRFITDRDTLMGIKDRYPDGLAVDMESNSIAHTCYRYGVPFISVRIISDTPWSDCQKEQYDAFWESAPQALFDMVSKIIG